METTILQGNSVIDNEIYPTEIPPVAEGTPLYVSPLGSDSNDGSKASPFKTPEKALEAVRSLVSSGLTAPVTVYFRAGEYKVTSLDFTGAGGSAEFPVVYKAYGDGEVSFNAGTTLKNELFRPVTDEAVLARLNESVRDKIKVIDLTEVGLTLDEIGPLCSWGTSSTARKYPNDKTIGNNAEIFWNDARMTLARWPNVSDGFARFNGVVDPGDREKLIPGTTKLGDAALERVKTWKSLDSVGIFAYFMFDWADMASRIDSLDMDSGNVRLMHHSSFGYKDDGEYYFYNILEELDAEGEYYLDRENLKLYVYPPAGTETSDALITTVDKVMVTGTVSNLRFDSITFKGSRSDLMSLTGDNISVVRCRLINCYGSALSINGSRNLVHSTEASYLGKCGIILTGGDGTTLTHGNNIVENCYVHHFQEVYRTYHCGIAVRGCGNSIVHNEIAYTPHSALSFSGQEHLIAYNNIHDVVYEASDAGALYVGGDWTAYGNVIKYNLFKNIGGIEGKWPTAIYWDDGMSAGEIYGNIVENCSGIAILLGGGHNIKVHHNLVISDMYAIMYDDRFTANGWESAKKNIWSQDAVDNNTGMWAGLTRVPYMEEPWISKYPFISLMSRDINDTLNPRAPGNPAFSEIHNNVFMGLRSQKKDWRIEKIAYEMSTIVDNASLPPDYEVQNLTEGTYDLTERAIEEYSVVDWTPLPWREIGRYGHKLTKRD